MKRKFFIATDEEIKSGKTTDIYFERTKTILESLNVTKHVTAEFTVSSLPNDYEWAIFAGLDEVLKLLEGIPVDLYALPEGTLFYNTDISGIFVPLIIIEGDYKTFAVYETPILGFICQSSGIATKSARVRLAAGDSTVLSFGIRRMHPAIAPLIDRCAYIGGCDGVSSIVGAETISEPPKGTMPHALIITLGETRAWKSFDEIMPPEVPRIALIDTYGDEKMEAIKAAQTIANLAGVRLDTPGSRRGNFANIVREVRWELDIRGYKNVQIFVSGGLDESNILELKEAGASGFGVGTSISNAPTIDFAMDIVAINGTPVAKKGKFGGKKSVLRCPNCMRYKVVPSNYSKVVMCPECKVEMTSIHKKFLENGKIVQELPSVKEIRQYVLDQLKKVTL